MEEEEQPASQEDTAEKARVGANEAETKQKRNGTVTLSPTGQRDVTHWRISCHSILYGERKAERVTVH